MESFDYTSLCIPWNLEREIGYSGFRHPAASRGQRHHGLDGSCFGCVLCCHVDLIESVGTNESVEGQTALPAQFDEPRNELPGVAVSLVGADQANAAAEQVRHVDGDLRSQRRSG